MRSIEKSNRHFQNGHHAAAARRVLEFPPAQEAPTDFRERAKTNYELYDAPAPELHDLGILVEPDFARAVVHVRSS